MKSNDINFHLYAIYIIKNYLEENNNSEESIDFLASQLNCEYMILLTSSLNLIHKKMRYNWTKTTNTD